MKIVTIPSENEPSEDLLKIFPKKRINYKDMRKHKKRSYLQDMTPRSSDMPSLEGSSYALRRESKNGSIRLIHLRDFLSPLAQVGQLCLAALHFAMGPAGWAKGCEAEGSYREELFNRFINSEVPLASWGVHDCKKLMKLVLSESGGSGTLHYLNGDDVEKTFQV